MPIHFSYVTFGSINLKWKNWKKKVEVEKPFMVRALKPWTRNMKTNGLTFASMPNFTFFVASLKGMPL